VALANASAISADGTTLAPEPAAGGVVVVEELIFKPPFADHQTVRVQLAAGIVDDIGRPLANAERFPLEVTIDSYPPLAKFSGSFGILEANEARCCQLRCATSKCSCFELPELTGRRLLKRRTSRRWRNDAASMRRIRRVVTGVTTRRRSGLCGPSRPQTNRCSTPDSTDSFTVPAGVAALRTRPFEVSIPLTGHGFTWSN
jgi:hypothetical protein